MLGLLEHAISYRLFQSLNVLVQIAQVFVQHLIGVKLVLPFSLPHSLPVQPRSVYWPHQRFLHRDRASADVMMGGVTYDGNGIKLGLRRASPNARRKTDTGQGV